MKYRNTKTGTVIDVNAELSGNWMPVEAEKKAKTSPTPKKPAKPKK